MEQGEVEQKGGGRGKDNVTDASFYVMSQVQSCCDLMTILHWFGTVILPGGITIAVSVACK